MKTIHNLLLMFFTCLILNSCQDVEEPVNNVPTVITDTVKDYSGRSAYLSGSISSKAKGYFLISTSEDFTDARKIEAYAKDENYFYAGVEDLTPGTTYYYVLCATDGRSEVRGQVQSFKTTAYLSIESVTMGQWGEDGAVAFVPEEPIGIFVADSYSKEIYQRIGNWSVSCNNSTWKLPEDILLPSNPQKMYAYHPYNKEVSSEIDGLHFPVYTYSGIDYLYGSSEELSESHMTAHIEMKHAMARITFSITKSKESDTYEYVTLAYLCNNRNDDNARAISVEGTLDITSGGINPKFYYNDGIFRECKFQPNADKAEVIEMLAIPTSFAEGTVMFQLVIGQQTLYVSLPAEKWEAGKQYDYPLQIVLSKLVLGDVHVEDWNNNEGGSITINQ